jgi:hypothetical protein
MAELLIYLTVEQFDERLNKFAETILGTKTQSKEPNSPEYRTRKEVSKELHVSFPTLNRFDKEGILTARKIGGRVLYLQLDIEKAINQDQNLKYRRVSNGR